MATFKKKKREEDIVSYAQKELGENDPVAEEILVVLEGLYDETNPEMKISLLEVKNDAEFWEWINKNYEF